MWGKWLRGLGAVLCVVGLLAAAPAAVAADKADKEADYFELMRVFADTFEQIERNYVQEVDRRELLEAALQGMLGKLDSYSSYISPEELTRFTQVVEQEFGGIGIQVHLDPETNWLTVMTPLPGTPAYKAGILAGDRIVEIESKSTKGFRIEDAVKVLKGPPGDSVTIGIQRPGSDKIEQVTIVRELIQVATVLGDRYKDNGDWEFFLDEENGIALVRLTHFSRRTADELEHTLRRLSRDGMKALVLDLRFNPGGLLGQATEVADLFVDSGRIVSTKGRNTPERVWEATSEGTYNGFPIVVLVNRFSASASEIVSACLQDHKRATIIGERTWGKGSVQNVIELEEGSSALKLTTASYHRPSGKNIHKFPDAKDSDEWGVLPDEGFEIKLSLDELRDLDKYRRERDVLTKNGPPTSDFQDRQLTAALDHLREKLGVATAADDEAAPDEKKPNAARPDDAGDKEKESATAPVALPRAA